MNNAASVRAASGHDAPVHYKSDDLYNRWPVATAISRAIHSSPANWSTRIGLYGRWGEGKTSVLNFLEKQQHGLGNVVVRYTSWGASTDGEMWRSFSKALREGLKRSRAEMGWRATISFYFRRYSATFSGLLRVGGRAANLKLPGVSIGTDFASELIQKHFRLTRKDVEAMTDVLGERRVIVIIDDLDRADPVVVPKLLLALRDLLDYSRFTFVLAFDKRVVARSLAAHNEAWKDDGNEFLDKIIDFPFDLPPPSSVQVRKLAEDQFEKLCPFVPIDALQAVSSVLPANPRKLKLMGRMLASSKSEADRHDAGEINWEIAILFVLLRLENEELAEDLLTMSMDVESEESSWLRWAMLDEAERQAAQAANIDRLVGKHSLGERKERITALVQKWVEAIPSAVGESLRYHAMFGVSPHSLTWGEFRAFFGDWRGDKDSARSRSFIRATADRVALTEDAVAREFGESLIGHYAMALERAADAESGESHLLIMNEALDCLTLMRQCFIGDARRLFESGVLLELWKRLYELARKWRHFDANPREPELREQEALLLSDFARILDRPLEIYDCVKPWEDVDSMWGERQARLEEQFRQRIQSAVEDAAISIALEFVAVPGRLKRLRSEDEYSGARYLLTSVKSPLLGGPRKSDLMNVLAGRRGSRLLIEDSSSYLAMILSILRRGDPFTSVGAEDFLSEHKDFVELLWGLLVSKPCQFRGLYSLREKQAQLIKAGPADLNLNTPDWMIAPEHSR